MKRGKCIVAISHSNYMVKSAGVEKSLKEMCQVLSQNNIHVIQIFPIIEVNKLMKKVKSDRRYVGINIDNHFQYADFEKNLCNLVRRIQLENEWSCLGIQLHHLHGWDLDELSVQLKKLMLPVKFFIHDFCTLCEDIYSNEGKESCQQYIDAPNADKCGDCKCGVYNLKWYNSCKNFFETLERQIVEVIAPAKVTLKNWLLVYGSFKDISAVRGHLQFEGEYVKNKENRKLRIAYIGSASKHKGYNEWNQFIIPCVRKIYDVFYFGNSDEPMPYVEKVFVDFQKGSIRMEEALRKHNIDIVFLWSTCLEAYSYTSHESYAAGCFILTNKHSGNIADIVVEYEAGKVFSDIQTCVDYLGELDNVKNDIRNYCGKSFPLRLEPNHDIENLLKYGDKYRNNYMNYPNRDCQLQRKTITLISLIYRMARGKY